MGLIGGYTLKMSKTITERYYDVMIEVSKTIAERYYNIILKRINTLNRIKTILE